MDSGESREPERTTDHLRVGDADRTAALSALDSHLEAGRITVDEYGDRSADASVAVTRSDLARLFADLPDPHPMLPSVAGSPRVPAVPDRRRHAPPATPMIALGLGMLVLVSSAAALTLAGLHVGGLMFLPLFFLVVGGLRHRGRGPHY